MKRVQSTLYYSNIGLLLHYKLVFYVKDRTTNEPFDDKYVCLGRTFKLVQNLIDEVRHVGKTGKSQE